MEFKDENAATVMWFLFKEFGMVKEMENASSTAFGVQYSA